MRIAAFLLFLLLIIAGGALATLSSFQHFRSVENFGAERCAPVRGIAKPGDIRIDRVRRTAFIAARRSDSDTERGAIHQFSLDDPLAESGWRDSTAGTPADFLPHGIDFYDDGETRRLFVVNSAAKSIELYDISDAGDFTHLETFTERRLTSPNSVAAVGPRAFYVTNDARAGRNSLFGRLNFLTRASTGDVYFSDGAQWRLVAQGLRFANGIAVSPTGADVAVAESAAGAVKIFARDPVSNQLDIQKTLAIGAAPENLTYDESGSLWIGALPKPLATGFFVGKNIGQSPSQIIRINKDGRHETVLSDRGDVVSASTVAARHGKKMLIGSAQDEKFLICDLPLTGQDEERP